MLRGENKVAVLLTSLDDQARAEVGMSGPARDQVVRLARLARDCGLDGVVASPLEVHDIRAACGEDFVIVTPGIRPASRKPNDDQARTMEPSEALAAGAHYLVIGRPITAAPDPRAAAEAIAGELATSR